MGDSSVELYGVDVMKVPLQMGKQKLPMATFQPADIEQSLPFEDNTFHCILASRLLVHVVDLPKACDELIRVLKPGGLFICCEANMDVSMQLLTTDRRLQGNLQTKVQHMTKMCANPDAATLAYQHFQTRASTRCRYSILFVCGTTTQTYGSHVNDGYSIFD
jgi:ubiquinone/menaquinone biosynthesis C-methylase UbiE